MIFKIPLYILRLSYNWGFLVLCNLLLLTILSPLYLYLHHINYKNLHVISIIIVGLVTLISEFTAKKIFMKYINHKINTWVAFSGPFIFFGIFVLIFSLHYTPSLQLILIAIAAYLGVSILAGRYSMKIFKNQYLWMFSCLSH